MGKGKFKNYLKIFHKLFITLVVSILLFNGCGSNKNLKVDIPVNVPGNWADKVEIKDLPVTYSLLDMIEEESLKDLVKEALENNHDIKATLMRLKASNFILNGGHSVFLPSVTAGLSKGRNNQSVNYEGKNIENDQYQASLNVSWEIDIWGKLANEHDAQKEQFNVLREEYLYALDSLAGRVIQAWINVVATRKAILLEEERLSALKKNDVTLVSRYRQGLGKLDELSASKSKKELVYATLCSKKEDHARALRELELLMGKYPQGKIVSKDTLPDIKAPPISVPATVLRNRPDIKAALSNIKAGNLQALASKKEFLPTVQISADMLKVSAMTGSLGSATIIWNIIGNIVQPIFQGGRIVNQRKARELKRDAAVENLAQKVLIAMKEIQDSLGKERELASQEKYLKNAVRESVKSRIYYENRYRNGLDTIQTLLIAQEEEMNIKSRLNDASAARVSNRIDLALSMGIGTIKRDKKPESTKEKEVE